MHTWFPSLQKLTFKIIFNRATVTHLRLCMKHAKMYYIVKDDSLGNIHLFKRLRCVCI